MAWNIQMCMEMEGADKVAGSASAQQAWLGEI
jgi:hypothetical protein